jgi:hypothetical protein
MKPQDTKCPNCGEFQGFFRYCDGPTMPGQQCAHAQAQAHGFMLCADCGTAWGKNDKFQSSAHDRLPSIALVAVDPGIVTGVAVWCNRLDAVPVATATFRARKEQSWIEGATNVTSQLSQWLRQYQFQKDALGFIEEPAFFDTSSGHMVARRGDFCKLAMIAGWEIAILDKLTITPRLVGIQNWKGQLPKQVVRERIQKVLGKSGSDLEISEHEWDAIGIGLAARGMLDL